MSDQFIDLVLGVQAVRRTIEREVAGLGGASGIAAVPYPHQLANVQRILTDTRIRHLIADEVGLGKTVQALMILNALQLQNKHHRALILVPEGLSSTWWKECTSRGHFTPVVDPPAEDDPGSIHVRITYYERLGSLTEIDPAVYDLLIVDEIHRLQASLRQRISDVAADFRQLLLLSATPRLEEEESHRQLLSILEPERVAMATFQTEAPETVLRARETQAAELLAQGGAADWTGAGFLEPPERDRAPTVATTYSALRRIINTRRRHYPDLLPRRELCRVPVEPTEDEVERQSLVWKFIHDARHAEAPIDLARLGQVAIRSPDALSERINILRGRDQRDPKGFLAEANRRLDPANGDTRLEALVDLLVDIWAEDPDEAVLVVGEDNPTVDYLEKRLPRFLPEVGPREARRPLKLAVKRNRDAAATANFIDLFEEHESTFGGFSEGDQQLLVAADIAQVGLNLQHARKIIFFSMPWSPEAVEQWIGRIDRLGSAALMEGVGERTIDIHAIYQRGQVDERVVTVLDEFEIFRRSVRLDGDEIKLIKQHIEDAALDPHAVSWEKLSAEARAFARDDHEESSFQTPLSRFLPWTAERARQLSSHLDEAGIVEPLIGRSASRRFILRAEAGLKGWMRLMARADQIRFWSKRDPEDPDFRFHLIHYPRPDWATKMPDPRFALPGLDPYDGQRYAYIDSRRALHSPPVRKVALPENDKTQLAFLDHGDPVHEALVAGWTALGRKTAACQWVKYPPGHILAEERAKGAYLITIVSWVPGRDHLQDFDERALLARAGETRVRQEQKPFFDAVRRVHEELRADRSWLNSLFTPRLDVIAGRWRNGAWEIVDGKVAHALLAPFLPEASGKSLVLASGRASGLVPALKQAMPSGMTLLVQEQAARHRRSLAECPHLRAAVASRRYQALVEAEEIIALRRAQLDQAADLENSEQGFMRSRYKVLRNARDAALAARDVRMARLDAIVEEVATPRFEDYRTLVVLVGGD
jgi:ATP-dependent helicase HepA